MHKFCYALLILICFSACDEKAVFHEYKSLPDYWESDAAVVFKVNKLDSLINYNLFITLRNTNEYAFSNLFLISELQFPNGKTITDTLEYKMARPDGSWLGEGFGDLKENKLWYKENFRFTEAGEYQFRLKQAMRRNGSVNPVQELGGIVDVGLRIEKIKE
ncbi:MAG: gliding motility lipoprotein GldH [Leeuwenhoekiella sp.]|uniref:gliding motility lipoprotein GldH n=1 Tax=Leeuwenhoekiella sp. MAR_2009_132 TaxID=1392489 RepID=UPI00055BC799|nr:gliding motility lipoprotein GldH [Leeuwenhoekiella sp. MAR_2009_132]MDP5044591.1 gliding motility lipoprotein GldH [Leeuwenhoekiella sp.]